MIDKSDPDFFHPPPPSEPPEWTRDSVEAFLTWRTWAMDRAERLQFLDFMESHAKERGDLEMLRIAKEFRKKV